MKNSIRVLGSLCIILGLAFGCKKDKQEKGGGPAGGDYATTEIKVTIPEGSSLDLSTTKVVIMSQAVPVGGDGAAEIPFNKGTHELACLFDAADNLLLMGFISDERKELSVASTAQAMLYFGLGVPYMNSAKARLETLNHIPSYIQYNDLRKKLEELFTADPLMLSGTGYMEAFSGAVGKIESPDIRLIGKQIKVENADFAKSGLEVKPTEGNDESIDIVNHRLRRAYAFLYRTGYKEKNKNYVTVINTFHGGTASDNQVPVKSGITGNGRTVTPQTTGPITVPLRGNEVEAIWRIRIVGPGGSSGMNFTNDEADKLKQLWLDFFAIDLLLPTLLDILGHSEVQYDIRSGNLAAADAFMNAVKPHISDGVMDMVKKGAHIDALRQFQEHIDADYYKRTEIEKALIGVVKEAKKSSGQWAQSGEDIESEAVRQGKLRAVITKLNDGVKIHLDDQIKMIYHDGKTIDEWTIKIKDDDVSVSPKHSQTMRFTNHTLTVSADPDLSSGNTLEYEWTTAGTYGVLKSGSTSGTQITTTSKSITYYGEEAPADDNIEKVYVQVYIKNTSGAREYYGSDTATINIKKVKILMRPNNPTLTPSNGSNAVQLTLLNADETNPIIQTPSVQYKVDWSTAGSYGHFSGNTTQVTTSDNRITYIATDDEVKSAKEHIIARVYFKLENTGWMLREEVKGTVNIENDPKKIVYYAPLSAYHDDRPDGGGVLWHYANCGVAISPVKDAITYSVEITLPGINPNTYSESWSANSDGWLRGYMYAIDPNTTGTYYVGYGAGWGSCADGDCDHSVPDCSGGEAKVTIIVK